MITCCKYTVLVFFTISCFTTTAQSTAGITNIPDTSYTTHSAFLSINKKYPDIKLVGEYQSAEVKEEKNITYSSYGNRRLKLDAFYPLNKIKGKRAAIMIIHGGGWRSGNRTQHYPLAQRLAKLGYVCFTPEYRLSTEALYPAAVHDLKAAVRWIRSNANKYNIDTAKVAVLGFSAGGQLAALLATTNNKTSFEGAGNNLKFSSRVNALINMDGTLSFVHPESGEADDSKKTSASTYWFGYSKKENYKLLEAASPLTHVDKFTPPTLFINSSVERMHAGRNDFIRVLQQSGTYAEVKTFPEAPHHFPFFHPWFEPSVKYIDEFLRLIFLTKIKRLSD